MGSKIFKIVSIFLLLFLFRFGNDRDSTDSSLRGFLLPQYWNFFTVDPYSSHLFHYKIDDNYNLTHLPLNTSDPTEFFGLYKDRRRRKEGIDLIYSEPVEWRPMSNLSEEDLIKIINENSNLIEYNIDNILLDKGLYVTIKKEILPIQHKKRNIARKAFYIFKIK